MSFDMKKPSVDVVSETVDLPAEKQYTPPGRPMGSKNKTTIFKEALKEGFMDKLAKDGYKVFDAVVDKAIGPPSYDKEGNPILDSNGKQMYIDGDATAQKMLMDRLVPAGSIHQTEASGSKAITINISKLVASTGTSEEYEGEIEDAEIVE